MTRTSKTLFLTLTALVCLHIACTAARADDSSGGVINNALFSSGGFSNAASSSSGIMATNGNTTIGAGLFVSTLTLSGSIMGAGTIMINTGNIDFTNGSAGFLMIVGNSTLRFQTNGFNDLIFLGTLGDGGIINSGTLISNGPALVAPEPATWLLVGLGLPLLLRTRKLRRRPA